MTQPLLDFATPGRRARSGRRVAHARRVRRRACPPVLRPWLGEPGLLTARVRAACGPATRLRLLQARARADRSRACARRLGVDDTIGVRARDRVHLRRPPLDVRAVDACRSRRCSSHPWLRDLGEHGLGESLSAVEDVRREPLEYIELRGGHPLARAACPAAPAGGSLWARRAVYRLAGSPILVQEVFLPALGRCD